MKSRRDSILALGLALACGACASYSGHGLVPGVATATEVRRVMGEPAQACPLADGGQNWVYPRGPAGVETFDVLLDRDGVVKSIENVLDERSFARVRRGETNKQDVLCRFGPPIEVAYFARRRELVWDYRFQDMWGYPARFHVLFNDDGVVTNTMQIREDYGDGDAH